MKKVEFYYKVSSVLLFATFGFFFAFVFYVFYPLDIIEVVQPYKILTPEVERGGNITYLVEYNKYYDFPATVYRNIICEDGNLVTLAPFLSNVPKKMNVRITRDVPVPAKTSVGNCYLEVQLLYSINKFKEQRYIFETETFLITE